LHFIPVLSNGGPNRLRERLSNKLGRIVICGPKAAEDQ
jgi:hypothetical protein